MVRVPVAHVRGRLPWRQRKLYPASGDRERARSVWHTTGSGAAVVEGAAGTAADGVATGAEAVPDPPGVEGEAGAGGTEGAAGAENRMGAPVAATGPSWCAWRRLNVPVPTRPGGTSGKGVAVGGTD